MLRNYLIIAWRNLIRKKGFSFINITGLSIGMAAAILEFLKLVIVSFVIAAPLGFWAMHSWLQDFPYRVAIHWWVFALAGATALIIALFTVSFQAIKAAIANPVKSLRTE